MLAEYTVVPDFWVDMPEAQPRARARIKNKNGAPAQIIIEDDGSLSFDPADDIEVDTYQAAKYKDIREEVRVSAPIGVFADKVRIIPAAGQGGQGHGKPAQQKEKG